MKASIKVDVLPREDGSRDVAEKASADHVGVAEVASRVRAPPSLRSTSEGDTQFHDSQPEDHFKVSFGNPTIVETWRQGQKIHKIFAAHMANQCCHFTGPGLQG